MTDIKAQINQIVDCTRVSYDELMKLHTTFRVGGPADIYIKPNASELSRLIQLFYKEYYPYQIIGNGSNLLVGDKGIRGAVIEIGAEASGILHMKEGDTHMLVAEAGASLAALAQKAASFGLKGLEFAAGIPGTVGGAVTMNAGAYGGEIKDVISSATVLTGTGEKLTLSRDELDLSYRHSCIPEKSYIVISATFSLEKGEEEEIRATMSDYTKRRVEKQPLEFPSAGSTFKRPEGYFAGKLIEDAGLRGYRVGDAQVSEKHCGFVINRGNATAAEILQLMQDVKTKVYEKDGVTLEPEVRIIGDTE